ncbi:MAG: CRISPR-associated protein Cas4 [Synergistaceae bacterium]|jgi:CRISPR-associated exonuclease Cas4|nr:CRISPR-associated protein Cas4 [Synergistaceae bacterium]
MYSDEDLLPISGLQRLAFCERQWALVHMEQERSENVLTIEGRQLHEFVHEQGSGVRSGVRMVRGLHLRSLSLGLYGVADLVEFRPCDDGAVLPGLTGRWRPYPVEYKRGRKRLDQADEIQLCAQAICLEEMLNVAIAKGAVYYGQPKRRTETDLTPELRKSVMALCRRARELYEAKQTPLPKPGKHCASCSLENICTPELAAKDRSTQYVAGLLRELAQ